MKKLIGLISILAFHSALAHQDMKELPLDLSFNEMHERYQDFLQKQSTKGIQENFSNDPVLELTITAGEKLNNWLTLINDHRDEPLRLTDEESQSKAGIPITAPMKYSPKTIANDYKTLEKTMPKSLFNVFYGNEQIKPTSPVDDETFKKWGRKVSYLYQTTARWNMLSKYLTHYMGRRKSDVRGYHYLKTTKDIDRKIKMITSLPKVEQDEILKALIGICYNKASSSQTECEKLVADAFERGTLLEIKEMYMPTADKIWQSYFTISNPRRDIKWKKTSPNLMQVIFKDPKNNYIASWLKENVEDEFRWQGWRLEMSFVNSAPGVSYMRFAPNVTPNVSGGNIITMDENASLEEFSVKWTIRHEYGHILRLPDCYTEFYDLSEGVMVNYQLDTTDLMCSRSGKMNQRIYDELKRVYMK